jgi:hypothetical protein
VLVSNLVGSVLSAPATLTALGPPVIVAPPSSVTVLGGTAASLSVTASGSPPLAYQWRKNGTNVAGATGPVLAFASVQPTDEADYTVVVSNQAGAVTSAPPARLTVITFAASQASLPAYQSPGVFTVNCRIVHAVDRSLFFVVWQPTLPSGWVLQSVSGGGNPQISGAQVVFNGALPNPLDFTCTIQVPAGERGPRELRGGALYFLSGMSTTSFTTAAPDPLAVDYGALLYLTPEGTHVRLGLLGDSGGTYELQSSADFSQWISRVTLVVGSALVQTNLPTTNGWQFFRAEKTSP